MTNIIYHIVRVFRKLWYIIVFASIISPIAGLGVILISLVISMIFFRIPDYKKFLEDNFTEEEIRKLRSPEDISDEKYLELLVRYLPTICPLKVDKITTMTGVELTKDAFIHKYVINDRWHMYGEINPQTIKENILSNQDICKKLRRMIATNRTPIFRFWNEQTKTNFDIEISAEDIK